MSYAATEIANYSAVSVYTFHSMNDVRMMNDGDA
jgi:hypothetical protein